MARVCSAGDENGFNTPVGGPDGSAGVGDVLASDPAKAMRAKAENVPLGNWLK